MSEVWLRAGLPAWVARARLLWVVRTPLILGLTWGMLLLLPLGIGPYLCLRNSPHVLVSAAEVFLYAAYITASAKNLTDSLLVTPGWTTWGAIWVPMLAAYATGALGWYPAYWGKLGPMQHMVGIWFFVAVVSKHAVYSASACEPPSAATVPNLDHVVRFNLTMHIIGDLLLEAV